MEAKLVRFMIGIFLAILVTLFFIGASLYKIRLILAKNKRKWLDADDYETDLHQNKHNLNKLYIRTTRPFDFAYNHKLAIDSDIDQYRKDMCINICKLSAELKPAAPDFVHIGYEAWGDWYDLNLKHLYFSKRWSRDIVLAFEPNIFKRKIKQCVYAILDMF